MTSRIRLLAATAVPLSLMLSACGGGGGGVNSTPPPAVAPPPPPVQTPTPPPPPPPPPPAPPPPDFSTAEFDRSEGIAHANAVTAYQEGATGAGITVGIIDSGIDVDSQEFAGRISAASQDVAGSRSVDDETGHGTAVAGVIGAARNDIEIVGMAFDSTLLALRTDAPGTCNEEDGCSHYNVDIAQAVDVAIANHARTINISLGGDPATPQLRAAIGRAADAGIVVVISAGNDGAADPDPLSQVALTAEADGHVIIAGSVNSNDQISSFSNRAGVGQKLYLAALGNRVRSFDHTGTAYLYSGTSFAAPQIAGAVALLAQAFPNLAGREIVELLFASARDAGAAGDDPIYGQGVLDLAEAFRPQGTTSLAGSGVPVSTATNVTLSGPMGDARQSGTGAIILDGFDRAFALDLAATVQRTPAPRELGNALALSEGGRFTAMAGSDAMVAVSIVANENRASLRRLSLTSEEAERARVAAGMVAARIDRATTVAFGFSRGGESVGADLGGRVRPAFLVADTAAGDTGFASRPESSFALRRRFGSLGVTGFAESGDALGPYDPDHFLAEHEWRRADYAAAGIALDRRWGGLRLDASLSWLVEEETFLGARFGPAFGGSQGADSLFAGLGASFDAGDGWSLGADVRHGWTFARGAGAVLQGGELRSFAASADISRRGVATADDRLSLRIAQPLRVYRGGLDLMLPVSYDYATLTPGYAETRFNLAPEGREIDLEVAYVRPFAGGWIAGHLFYRKDPGHIAAMPDDVGAAIRFTLGF